jgi:hypothetical protein
MVILVLHLQGSAPGINKARPLLNDALRDQAAAMACGNDLMQRRLARRGKLDRFSGNGATLS